MAIAFSTDKTELRLESEIAVWLEQAGHRVWRQVQCDIGTADIVFDRAVIEVKRVLTRTVMFHAIGQVLLYRAAIDPSRAAIVVGRVPRGGLDLDIVRWARSVGVDIWFWHKGQAARPAALSGVPVARL